MFLRGQLVDDATFSISIFSFCFINDRSGIVHIFSVFQRSLLFIALFVSFLAYGDGRRNTTLDNLIVIAGGSRAGPADATDNGGKPNGSGGKYYGVAIGSLAKAYWASVALGDGASSDSLFGTAVGVNSYISKESNYSLSIGYNSKVTNSESAISLGNGASSFNANNAVSIGNNAQVTGYKDSVALGSNSTVSSDEQMSIGNDSLKRSLVNLKGGSLAADSSEAVTGAQLY
ncbi:hypothetical protein QLG07_02565, partial [Erwinia sp. V90_4]|nr:hypothetical protein [Erwinia sp. V90_4]